MAFTQVSTDGIKNGTITGSDLATNIDLVDMVRDHKTLVGSYYGSVSPHVTFERIIEFYKSGRLDINSVIERKYPLEKINEAYEDLESGKDGRGIIDFTI